MTHRITVPDDFPRAISETKAKDRVRLLGNDGRGFSRPLADRIEVHPKVMTVVVFEGILAPVFTGIDLSRSPGRI